MPIWPDHNGAVTIAVATAEDRGIAVECATITDEQSKGKRRRGGPMPTVVRMRKGGGRPASTKGGARPARNTGVEAGAEPARASAATATRSPPQLGLAARSTALFLLSQVLDKSRTFDDALADTFASSRGLALEPRDRGLARLIAATVLRRLGVLEALLALFMDKPLSDRHQGVQRILLVAAAQMLYLDTPPHAAINLAVAECRRRPETARFDKLTNAVLRRVSLEGKARLEAIDEFESLIPEWLRSSWVKAYGEPKARAIASASLREAALDLTCKEPQQAAVWAERLGGVALSTASVRLPAGGRIESLDGYDAGAWWVQDAAAALPARLLGENLAGREVADLCAAPGGKTCQLAAAGAQVTAVDVSAPRLQRIAENLKRLGLAATLVQADAANWQPERTFDAVLLDAPCSATGTIRRHPDILYLKRAEDVRQLAQLQTRLLDRAAALVRPGGEIVYCTCSLQMEEGEFRVQSFLARHPGFARRPINAGEAGVAAGWITREGDLRTLPTDTPEGDGEMRGMDGFFAARLQRMS